ncbi:hypothetical protein QOZ80_2BG0193110 [Eleusine coracana subsp. coracana]|nr:hypothetical protein QOZ80_2BG0193110 [Eleusine coracana subsp. coracana]
MQAALDAARAKDTNGRLAGVERLHDALDAAARRGLTPAEVTSLVDTCVDLTGDGNFRVAQGGLQALSAAAVLAGDHFEVHLNALVPMAVERLGDGKQPVRDAARQLLVTLMEISSPTIIVERAGNYAWTHKSRKVREEFVRTVAAAVGLFASTELPLQRVLLAPILQLMSDLNHSVRDAAISCIEEMYRNMGSQFHEELQRHNLPSYMLKEINACHLLNILSKELLGDFEACAEIFIPVLFKLVVITVLVIAESADVCIKTILQNCKVSRILPLIAGTAKNDRNAVLRARCCEYALLVLEYWADAQEIQRSADLYEDLIKCCVADATSEARATARACYRMFTKTWPERSHRLFMSFDPAMQRTINDEDWGHKQYSSSSLHQRDVQLSRASSHAGGIHFGYCTAPIVAMDKSAAISSESSLLSSSLLLSSRSAERSIESVLNSSKQKVSAIESLLNGVSMSDLNNLSAVHSTSLSLGVDPPSSGSPIPLSAPALDSSIASITSRRNGGSCLVGTVTQVVTKERSRSPYLHNLSSELVSGLTLPYLRSSSGKSQEGSIVDDDNDTWTKRSPRMQMDKHYTDMPYRDANYRNSFNNHVPHFQRPLRKQVVPRAPASGRHSFDRGHVTSSAMSEYTDGPASLSDALSEGLSPSSDWVARVAAFNFVQTLLQQGQKGIHEITQNFEKVLKLFLHYLDDPHHKVAQAAFSTLADIIPAFKKPFEIYIERMLPYVFSRLIDPKELIRQPCRSTLEIVSRTYSIDTLLPALVRSLDEQRPPKAKLAVLEFTNKLFNNYTVDSEGYRNIGFAKLWLSKLAPFIHEKNAKLKEASISGIISVYSHINSATVLNFILSLSIEEQNIVRRALKKHTPRIEFDLVNYLQSKKESPHPKSYDNVDSRTSSKDCYDPTLKKSFPFGHFSASTLDDTEGEKMNTMEESTLLHIPVGQTVSDVCVDHGKQCWEYTSEAKVFMSSRKPKNNVRCVETVHSWTDYPERSDATIDDENSTGTHLNFGHPFPSNGHWSVASSAREQSQEGDPFIGLTSIKIIPHAHDGPSIPQLLHQIANDGEASSLVKQETLHQLVTASTNNDKSTWTKNLNQILTAVLEVLDDSDSSVRMTCLLLVAEMLHNQKDSLEESIEIVLEKLLHMTKDDVAKVSNEAYQCLNAVLAKYDPFKCLAVIVSLLVNSDEKTLITGINCLTKLVGRLSQEELLTQLSSFLPALFDSFSNQSPDVRKTAVICLVDIYIMLGEAFVPYLESLSSTQLRLVTMYANKITQARSGAPVDANQ